jgi:hypothetical protein
MWLANPPSVYSASQLSDFSERYYPENMLGNEDNTRAFRLGARVTKDPLDHNLMQDLTGEERWIFGGEAKYKWR